MLRGLLGGAGKLASKLAGGSWRDIGQSRVAESRPQLEPLLKRFLIIFIRCVFDDNSIIPFADFVALFGLALPLF
jgi:hypothetical protein